MSQRIQKGRLQNGYTLMEALVVLALIGALVVILLPAFLKVYQKYRSETAVEQVVMNLRFARLAAVKKRYPYKVVINDNSATPPNTYKLFENPTKGTSTWENYTSADTTIPSHLEILSGGISEVLFSPRGSATITPPNTSTIRIQSADFIYRINVYPTGAVTKVAE